MDDEDGDGDDGRDDDGSWWGGSGGCGEALAGASGNTRMYLWVALLRQLRRGIPA